MLTAIPDEDAPVLIEYYRDDDDEFRQFEGTLVRRCDDRLVAHDRAVGGRLEKAARVDLTTNTVTVYFNGYVREVSWEGDLHDIGHPGGVCHR